MRATMRCLGALLLVTATTAMAPAQCGVDSYYWGKWDGSPMCQSCPVGKHSGGCTNCAADPEATKCISGCSTGSFHSEAGCTKCAPGRFQGARGMHTCHDCPAGMSQSAAGKHHCVACAIGTFSNKPKQTSCTTCNTCTAGKFGSTPAVGMDSASMCRCEACELGTESVGGASACTKCAAGKFQDDMGQSSCVACPEGKYIGVSGSSICRACTHGWTTAAAGADEQQDCNVEHVLVCPAGRKMVTVGMVNGAPQHACVNCAAGSYGYTASSNQHGGVCRRCPIYHYQDESGRTECVSCLGGTVSADRTQCVMPTHAPSKTPTDKPTAAPTLPPTEPTQQPTPTPTVVPGDCEFSTWGTWNTCSEECGSGIQSRARTIIVDAQGSGQPCPSLNEEQNCNTTPCPVHCEYEWPKAWKPCSQSCAGGFQTKHRVITQQAQHGGEDCPQDILEQVCNLHACPTPEPTKAPTQHVPTPVPSHAPTGSPTTAEPTPSPTLEPTKSPTPTPDPLDCIMSDWNKAACSKSCGAGSVSIWTRKILQEAKYGGNGCDVEAYRVKTVDCNKGPCPVDCQTGAWTAYSACSRSCGAGSKSRSRLVKHPAQFGGQDCPYLSHAEQCNAIHCPRDCSVGRLSEFTKCSKTCGGGLQMAYRTLHRDAMYGGKSCPALSFSRSCNEQACAVHCKVSTWQDWTDCSATCGGGLKSRVRVVTKQSNSGGNACPKLKQKETCGDNSCAVPCVMGEWKEWTKCTTTCGSGSQRRDRNIKVHPEHGGKRCDITDQTRVCSEGRCPIHCEVSTWGDWQQCTKSCAGGTQVRHRSVEQVSAWGGNKCPDLHDDQTCNKNSCPKDCVMTKWTKWGACSQSCGTSGNRKRTREISKWPMFGGAACSTHTREDSSCGRWKCPAKTTHCKVSTWSAWGACSVKCGDGGTMKRTRRILTDKSGAGDSCPEELKDSVQCNTHRCPIDCVLSKWSKFSLCSKTCGGGHMSRRKMIKVHPSYGGDSCGNTKDTEKCETDACPNDCIVGLWGKWSTCQVTCGGGKMHRSRAILQENQHGGKKCPTKKQSQVCNEKACPVDCVVGDWGDFSKCSRSCGDGEKTRTRKNVEPLHGGVPCPFSSHMEECGKEPCARHCKVGSWNSWGECSATCGTGLSIRAREVTQSAVFGGSSCPHLEQTKICNAVQCPVDCRFTIWTEFSDCSVSCGRVGIKTRSRKIDSYQEAGGKPCRGFTDKKVCDEGACPIHCEVATWSKWSSCSLTCGSGTETRKRRVEQHPDHGGYSCPALIETQPCPTSAPCAVDCKLGPWDHWRECTESCGPVGGTRARRRPIVQDTEFGGVECGPIVETETCNVFACPVDCKMGGWGDWSPCSHTCGGGVRFHIRSMEVMSKHGGRQCDEWKGTGVCNTEICPVDCEVNTWSSWTVCSKTCGPGSHYRYRSITREPQGADGKECPELKVERECEYRPCPIHCEVSEWEEYSECSLSCGLGGSRIRSRTKLVHEAHFGNACPMLHQTQECTLGPCPVHCVVSDWTHASACSKTCGGGSRTRSRRIISEAAHGGVCPSLKEVVDCNTDHCPTDCVLEPWADFTTCSAECGTGFRTRDRAVKIEAAHGGRGCGQTMEIDFCNTQRCGQDCFVTEWSDPDVCSESCGRGFQTRSRAVIAEAEFGGAPCPPLTLRNICNTEKCPVDCIVDRNAKWSGCSVSCGGGSKTKTKRIRREAKHGGEACPPPFLLTDERLCNTEPCPFDCVQTDWTDWTECDADCDGGQQLRFRTTLDEASNGGKACKATIENKACNSHDCPVDCLLSEYYNWGECSVSCGEGVETRHREITVPDMHGGEACPTELSEDRVCEKKECPVHCEVGVWSDWGDCSKSCGLYGERIRKRLVTLSHNADGTQCPHLTEGGFCNRRACPVDCETFAWTAWSQCHKTCGGGKANRVRQIQTNDANGGKRCEDVKLREERPCNTKTCRVDCVLTGWGPWSECSSGCRKPGDTARVGWKKHMRYISTAPSSTGLKCDNLYHVHPKAKQGSTVYEEQVPCNRHLCTTFPTTYPTKYPTTRFPTSFPTKTPTPWPSKVPTAAPTQLPDYCTYGETRNFKLDQSSLVGGQGKITGSMYMGGKGPWKLALDTSYTGDVSKFKGEHVEVRVGGKKVMTIWANSKSGYSEHAFIWNPFTTPSDFIMHYEIIVSKGFVLRNPTATCVDSTEDCKMSTWSPYTPCTQSCAGGTKTRTRSVIEKATQWGRKCPPVHKEQKPCNIHRCPWEMQQEAETADKKNCMVGGRMPGYTGRGYVRSMNLASGAPCEVSLDVDAPLSGRYEVEYRYETKHGKTHDIVTEAVDHSYTLAVDFPASDGKWSVATAYVDLFQGHNSITVKSKHRSLNIDSIRVIHMNLMTRCRPGKRIPLNWLQNAVESHDIKRSEDGFRTHGVVQDSMQDGMMRGRFDFGTRGPWEIHLDVKEPKFGGSKSQVYLSLNHRNMTVKATHYTDQKYHMVVMAETGAALQYLMKFRSSSDIEDDHLQVMNGVAICQGCDHVSCAIENGPKTWETEGKPRPDNLSGGEQHFRCASTKSGWCTNKATPEHEHRVVVRHHNEAWGSYDKYGHRAANTFTTSSKHHKCAMDKHYHKCECVCESKQEMAYDPDYVRENNMEHLSREQREEISDASKAAFDPHWLAHTGAGQHHQQHLQSEVAAP